MTNHIPEDTFKASHLSDGTHKVRRLTAADHDQELAFVMSRPLDEGINIPGLIYRPNYICSEYAEELISRIDAQK